MRLLFVEWEDGSKWEEMGFVEFSDLQPAIGPKVNEDMEAAVQRIFSLFWFWQIFQQQVSLVAAFSEKSFTLFINNQIQLCIEELRNHLYGPMMRECLGTH